MASGGAVIGALRGVLVLDTSDWTPAIGRARGDLSGLRSALEQITGVMDNVARSARNMGAGMTLGLTVPLTALAATSNKTASGFEASMKRVEAALKGVTGDQLKQLSTAAKELGPRVGKGATEAADGIEALGLAGVATADILGGALKASLDLAAAGAAPVSEAASLVTDAMGQFKVQAGDLPRVVKNVVGALDASKFGFQDFQGALAQGGGVAAAAGLSFQDFATAIAATSTQFSSGSDAGTSFKTYMQSLVPVSKQAEFAMQKLGIEFFDLKTGRMKPLAEQAEILRKALGGLSDKSKTDALKTIFGSDAARTAIGLMEKGREGIAGLQDEIANGDVGAKIDKRLEGEAAATVRMANAFESVKIAIGEAGLTALITSVKNAFAGFLEAIANASPAFLKIGVVIGAVAAALGPLMMALAPVVTFLVAKVARGFGMVGFAISAIIEPISTIGALLMQLGARAAIGRVLGMVARAFLGLSNPVGWAITAILLFKDTIVPALQMVWEYAKNTLGPPLTALFAQVGAVVSSLTSGPIGAGFSGLIALFKGVLDVAGTIVGGLVELIGVALVHGLEIAIRAISGVVEIVGDVVKGINALLSGDFVGAWQAAQDAVDAAIRTIIDIVGIFFPDLAGPIKAAYEDAKAWLIDGFAGIASSFGGIISGAVNWVAQTFPGIVASAKSVYNGVKAWLVDKFGALMAWIGNAAKWIGDKYAALKERLGFGGSKADGTPAAPAAPPAPKSGPPPAAGGGGRTVDFTEPKTPRAGRKKTGGGASIRGKFNGDDQEQLRIQAELEAARARGDKEAEKRIQDRLALSKQIEAYQRAGLSLDKAKIEAARDMAMIDAARAEANAKELADDRAAVDLDVARLGNDRRVIEGLERQAELRQRIAGYYEKTRDLAEATRLAEADQLRIDRARADVRRRALITAERERQLGLAQLRGDSEASIRRRERDKFIDDTAAAKIDKFGMSDADARREAEIEWTEQEQARQTGVFRETFRSGIRAALDGDLKGFVGNWWRDRMAKGLENALNSLSGLIERLFSKAGDGGGGGGFFAAIGKALGLVKVGTGASGGAGAGAGGAGAPVNLLDGIPGFATGGSFKVGGMGGIDNNLVAFRATKGEMVDIRRPGNDNGGAGARIFDFRGAVVTEELLANARAAASADTNMKLIGINKREKRVARRRLG